MARNFFKHHSEDSLVSIDRAPAGSELDNFRSIKALARFAERKRGG